MRAYAVTAGRGVPMEAGALQESRLEETLDDALGVLELVKVSRRTEVGRWA
jgi:hypothetical protein